MEIIRLEHIDKYFGERKALDDFSLSVKEGEFLTVIGRSGCGKTTLLRMIAGIGPQSDGQILIDGKDMTDVAPGQRDVAMVFQNYAIYPTMSVYGNIEFGLKNNKVPKEERKRRIREVAEKVGLTDYLDRSPSTLSGGQRQRVAIARALSMEPKLLVADEPVAALDVSIQAQIVNLFRHLREEHGFTILFIAHDLAMVEFLCDRVGVMNHGQLVEVGTTEDIFYHPTHPYTKKLLKAVPMLPGSRKRYGGSEKQRENE